MLKILNRTELQNIDDVEKEFPGCHILMNMQDAESDYGYLIAVSEEHETHAAMCDLGSKYPKGTIFYIGGLYERSGAIGVQNIV